jgi:hypothetical protein
VADAHAENRRLETGCFKLPPDKGVTWKSVLPALPELYATLPHALGLRLVSGTLTEICQAFIDAREPR